jgi:hypothetical protein
MARICQRQRRQTNKEVVIEMIWTVQSPIQERQWSIRIRNPSTVEIRSPGL